MGALQESVVNNEKTAIDLSSLGISNTTEILYNPSYEELFIEETAATLSGFEKGHFTELGAISVDTGIFTGRSPKDKYIVLDDTVLVNSNRTLS